MVQFEQKYPTQKEGTTDIQNYSALSDVQHYILSKERLALLRQTIHLAQRAHGFDTPTEQSFCNTAMEPAVHLRIERPTSIEQHYISFTCAWSNNVQQKLAIEWLNDSILMLIDYPQIQRSFKTRCTPTPNLKTLYLDLPKPLTCIAAPEQPIVLADAPPVTLRNILIERVESHSKNGQPPQNKRLYRVQLNHKGQLSYRGGKLSNDSRTLDVTQLARLGLYGLWRSGTRHKQLSASEQAFMRSIYTVWWQEYGNARLHSEACSTNNSSISVYSSHQNKGATEHIESCDQDWLRQTVEVLAGLH